MKLNSILYKGYSPNIRFSEEDKILYGYISGIKDLVNFECDNVSELEAEFYSAVDDYLEFCKSQNKTPNKPENSFNCTDCLHWKICEYYLKVICKTPTLDANMWLSELNVEQNCRFFENKQNVDEIE